MIGELLSGSAPPVEFFNPFGLVILPALYGSGALLIRELSLRWGKRWPTILVLGLAYGVVEEGLMVKSFFDPNWMDLGLLGVYGRWMGVNWIWSVSLMVYHATVSIAIPIMLVELIYPHQRDQPWLARRGRVGLSALLVAVVAFGYLALTTYRPPFLHYLFAIFTTIGLGCIGRHLPTQFKSKQFRSAWKSFWIGTLGLGGMTAFFLCSWALPAWGLPPLLTFLALAIGSTTFILLVLRASGGGTWDDKGRFALAAGALSFFILLAPLSENDPSRLDNPAGMTVVALLTLVALVILRWHIHRRETLKLSAS